MCVIVVFDTIYILMFMVQMKLICPDNNGKLCDIYTLSKSTIER